MALREGLDGGQARRRLHLGAPPTGAVTQHADEAVDLADRLACHVLDRLQRLAGAPGVLLVEQPRGPGLDEDHVDRVPCRVVEAPRDARALLGHGQAAFALSFLLGP